jgi:hypothetical protein
MLLDPVPHNAAHSAEAQTTHLAPQLSGIVTAVFPALVEISTSFFDDGKGRWAGNVFVERLRRSLEYEQVYLYA